MEEIRGEYLLQGTEQDESDGSDSLLIILYFNRKLVGSAPQVTFRGNSRFACFGRILCGNTPPKLHKPLCLPINGNVFTLCLYKAGLSQPGMMSPEHALTNQIFLQRL
jgi:hypothetical protein